MSKRSSSHRKPSQVDAHPRVVSVYLSGGDVQFLQKLPGDPGWSASVTQVIRDLREFFNLPPHVQDLLRGDMAKRGCLSERDYVFGLLLARYTDLASGHAPSLSPAAVQANAGSPP